MVNPMHRAAYADFLRMLVAARQDSGMTQTEVALQLGKPQSYVSKFERGERRLDLTEFLDVASVMGIDAAVFVTEFLRARKRAARPGRRLAQD